MISNGLKNVYREQVDGIFVLIVFSRFGKNKTYISLKKLIFF